MVVTSVLLAAAFFPFLFYQWGERDDEGVFVFALREFLSNHGKLYSTIWTDMYGPFYYLVMSAVYRVIHQQPTLENGRWIVLVMTAMSAAFFGAAVWRVTRNLPCTLLCEIASFVVVIEIAGNEPMHPGGLGVLLVAIVAFALSSYAATKRTAYLTVIGVATGALMMTKVNAGVLAGAAVVFALVVGSRNTSRRVQYWIAGLTAVLPLVLVLQNISMVWAATFAFLVVISIVGLFAVTSIDPVPLTSWPLLPVVAGAAAAIVCSLAFPLLSGTPLSDEIGGVFIRPLSLPNAFTVAANVRFDWIAIALTVAGVCAAVTFRRSAESVRVRASWVHAALAAVALWLLGIGATVYGVAPWQVARWLPALVLLPALAVLSEQAEPVRLALRSVVALATLQILVAYPVAGSQVGWGTIAMVVPCTMALAVGLDRFDSWRHAGPMLRGGAVAAVCIGLMLGNNAWPITGWHAYLDNKSLDLPGTGLMRIEPSMADLLQLVTANLRAHCDTFYGVPNENGFYIFTGLPAVTGMVANAGITGLTEEQKGQVVDALRTKRLAHQRVCILRDLAQPVALPHGALTRSLRRYSKVVARVGPYTISRYK